MPQLQSASPLNGATTRRQHRRRLSAAIKRARKDDCPILVASLQSLSQDVLSIGDLVAQRTPFIVAGDYPFTLRLGWW